MDIIMMMCLICVAWQHAIYPLPRTIIIVSIIIIIINEFRLDK